ncbi:MAG: hypothetical protein WBD40_01360 [Tepidisphaeraceae bacterium]
MVLLVRLLDSLQVAAQQRGLRLLPVRPRQVHRVRDRFGHPGEMAVRRCAGER